MSIRSRKHGMSQHPLWSVWRGMKERCLDENNKRFSDYGGRGIKICQRWLDSFQAFVEDMGDRPAGHQLDRIDNDGNYEPGNCKWSTRSEQMLNRRNNHILEYRGERLTVSQWSEKLGMTFTALATRIRRGWTVEEAIETPCVPRG